MVRLGRSAGWARSIAGKSAPEAAPAAPRNRRRGSMLFSIINLRKLTPEAVVGPADIVPLVGRLEPPRLGHVLFTGRFVERNPQAWLVGNCDVSLVHDGL